MRSLLFACLCGLGSSAVTQADGVKYKKVVKNYEDVEPSVLEPTTGSAKRFGQVVAIWNGRIAVSSTEVAMDYDTNYEMGNRGRINLYGSDYLRQFTDSGQDFLSGSFNDGFGKSLALWEGTMLVGAPYDSANGQNSGKAYVFYGSNYNTRLALTADHPEEGDYFGYSVALLHGSNYYSEGMAVVGAYGHDHDKESTTGQGCVFVYASDSSSAWSLVGKLEPQDFEHKDHGGFGYSLAAYGNTLAVGTYAAEKAFVFELLGHQHECPPVRPEEENEDLPSECVDNAYSRRGLRSLQGEEKRFYTEWKYEHIMTVGLEEEHKPEQDKATYSFGHTVALINDTVLTLAVGAPDSVDSYGSPVGMVYVMSIMERGDVTDGWYPEGYDHHEEDKQREEQERQEREEQEREEREEREAGKRRLQGPDDKNRFRTWNPQQYSYCGDKMGNFWILEAVLSGSLAYDRFGDSIDIDYNTLLIGNNPSVKQSGRAELFVRSTDSSGSSSDNPLVSGPLYGTKWSWKSDLKDTLGTDGDHFGFSVAFYGMQAVVGTIMPDLQSDGTFGTGVAYVYDRVSMVPEIIYAPTQAPQVEEEKSMVSELSNTHSAVGITFLSSSVIILIGGVLAAAYAIYWVSGGEATPRELICGSDQSGPKKTSKQIRLASMDDSGMGGSPQGLQSAYTGLDTSSSHGTTLNRLPTKTPPSSSPRHGGKPGGSFTPQSQRKFKPRSKPSVDDL